MRWDERQLAMLREMGVRLVFNDSAARGGVAVASPAETVEPLTLEAPAPRTPTAPAPTAPAPAVAAPPPVPQTAAGVADWLVVVEYGEAASEPAGAADEAQLLANMLRAIGVAEDGGEPARRARVVDARRLDAAAMAALRAASKPRIGLALGRAAARLLAGRDEPIGRLRGRLHDAAGLPVVVSCAPAYLLRHADEKAKAWADLCLAVATVDGDGRTEGDDRTAGDASTEGDGDRAGQASGSAGGAAG